MKSTHLALASFVFFTRITGVILFPCRESEKVILDSLDELSRTTNASQVKWLSLNISSSFVIKKSTLENFTGLVCFTAAKSGISYLERGSFDQNSRLEIVDLSHANLSTFQWQNSRFRENTLVNLTGNPLNCEEDCRNAWLFSEEVQPLPKFASNSGEHKLDVSISGVFRIRQPQLGKHGRQKCKSRRRTSCKFSEVELIGAEADFSHGSKIDIACKISHQDDEAGAELIHFFKRSGKFVRKTAQGTRLRQQPNDTIVLQLIRESADESDIGWFVCMGYGGLTPAFGAVFVAVETPLRLDGAELDVVGLHHRLYKYSFLLIAYPIKINVSMKASNGSEVAQFLLTQSERGRFKAGPVTVSVSSKSYWSVAVELRWLHRKEEDYELELCQQEHCLTEVLSTKPKNSSKSPEELASYIEERKKLDQGPKRTSGTSRRFLSGTVLLGAVMLAAIVIYCWCTLAARRRRSKLDGRYENVPLDAINVNYHQITSVRHIRCECLTTMEKIGQGAFGEIHLAQWRELKSPPADADSEALAYTKVAIKRTKTPSYEGRRTFEAEAGILAKLEHENVVRFYGICVEDVDILLVFEFMDLGDLKSYLIQRGPHASLLVPEETAGAGEKKVAPKGEKIAGSQMIQICRQISDGLAYLTSMHIVHRDLAARNCLLQNSGGQERCPRVKVSDFGMSRDVYFDGYYRLGAEKLSTALPVRWLPPESLLLAKFSRHSDVWSLGVTLWEVFSYGRTPYGHLSNTCTAGQLQLEQPAECPDEVYDVMTNCWRHEPQDRIYVDEVQQKFRLLANVFN